MRLLVLLAVLPLTSCGLFAKTLGVGTDCERYAQELDFATSEGILRGAWHGTVDGLSATGAERTLHLDVAASRPDTSTYEIEGSFLHEDALVLDIVGVADDDVRGGAILARVEAP